MRLRGEPSTSRKTPANAISARATASSAGRVNGWAGLGSRMSGRLTSEDVAVAESRQKADAGPVGHSGVRRETSRRPELRRPPVHPLDPTHRRALAGDV